MKDMIEKKDMLIPTNEVITEKIALTDAIEKGIKDNSDIDDLNVIMEKNEDLNEKYDFYDRIFVEGGKKGIKDIRGNVRVPALYTDFCSVYHYDSLRSFPVAAADDSGKFALVSADGTGKPLCPFAYDYISYIQFSSCFAAYVGKKISIIDKTGKVLVEPIADSYCECMNGIIVFESEGKSGLVTEFGTYVPPIYDDIDEKDDAVYATLGDKGGFIDEEGKFVEDLGDESCEDVPLLYWINF